MLKSLRALSGLLFVGLLALSAFAQAGETLERVIENKTLVVGTTGDQPPLTALNRQGKFMGLDIDLARALANAMRVELKIEKIAFGDLMSALDKGKVDMVVSGVAITPERSMKANFVGPYMLSGKSIVARRDSIEQLAAGNLASADVTLAALKNSTSATFVREVAPKANLVEVATTAEAVELIIAGKADGMVADEPTCLLAVLRNPDAGLVTLDKPMTVEPMGIAIAAGDAQFLNLVQNYVRAYEGTGLLKALRGKWLEDSSWIAALP
jgi:polar amino acid transport system substrate-binding protein